MIVYTHWGGAGNGGAGGDQDISFPQPEHRHSVKFNLSYHELVSRGGVEAGTTPIQQIVGEACPGYPGDKGKACRSR